MNPPPGRTEARDPRAPGELPSPARAPRGLGATGPDSRWWRALAASLGGAPWPRRRRVLLAVALFLVAFVARSLHALDLAPVMDSPGQPGARMASRYDDAARVEAFLPRDHDPSDTGILARPPGYPLFLRAVYAVLGRSFLGVQCVQNLLNSFAPVLVFLLGERLLGPRVGAVSGALVALSHHFAYYSNLVVPDTLSVLPIVAAVLVLASSRRGSLAAHALAGAAIGLSAWLRPNTLVLGPFMGGALSLAPRSCGGRRAGAALALASILAIAPLTLRNWLLFHEFVPVSINMGIVLWEGIADFSGDRFGAKSRDFEVAWQEAEDHRDPRYAEWWASPDGIERDRERVRKSWAVIRAHPLWYGRTVVARMGEMLRYTGGEAPLLRSMPGDAPGTAGRGPLEATCWFVGRRASFLRPLVRALEEGIRMTSLALAVPGAVLVAALSRRRALLLSLVPLCYLSFQSLMHLEFRVTLPMHCFVFVFAAVTWVCLGYAVRTVLPWKRR